MDAYLKLYIAVLADVPDYMVPTLVAHSMLGAHLHYFSQSIEFKDNFWNSEYYTKWLHESFRKCVVKVNRKEFEKITNLHRNMYLGHENTVLNAEKSCAIPLPVWSDNLPNVLKFAKLWSPTYEN